MAKGECVIDENRCKGCGFCVHFCSRNCIVMATDKFGPQGYLLPVPVAGAQCTGCGVCAWLCPDQAIEVYRFVESTSR